METIRPTYIDHPSADFTADYNFYDGWKMAAIGFTLMFSANQNVNYPIIDCKAFIEKGQVVGAYYPSIYLTSIWKP